MSRFIQVEITRQADISILIVCIDIHSVARKRPKTRQPACERFSLIALVTVNGCFMAL